LAEDGAEVNQRSLHEERERDRERECERERGSER